MVIALIEFGSLFQSFELTILGYGHWGPFILIYGFVIYWDGDSILLLSVSLFIHEHMKLISSLDLFLLSIWESLLIEKAKIHYKNFQKKRTLCENLIETKISILVFLDLQTDLPKTRKQKRGVEFENALKFLPNYRRSCYRNCSK